jgi:AraC-like DNA-binding protein
VIETTLVGLAGPTTRVSSDLVRVDELIRRRRLQEAAERVRGDPRADLARIAHDLGYVDHAHLTTDFRRVLGFTPSGYRRGEHS